MLSSRFQVRDFLTKDQSNVWPKYLVVQPTLLDKLELIADELERLGKPSAIKVLSGFRTPQYNAKGVCRRCGRAKDSRHMYGDASDIYVDGDGDGRMDDLNGDGKVTVADAKYLAAIADQVEAEHPELTGGHRRLPRHRRARAIRACRYAGVRRALVAAASRNVGRRKRGRGGSASCAASPSRFPDSGALYCLQGAVGSGFGLSTTRR